MESEGESREIATAALATSATDLYMSVIWSCNMNMWVKHMCDLWPLACVWLQWIISELACYTYSMVVVPLYDTLGPDAIRFIINTGKNTLTHVTHTDKQMLTSHTNSQTHTRAPPTGVWEHCCRLSHDVQRVPSTAFGWWIVSPDWTRCNQRHRSKNTRAE